MKDLNKKNEEISKSFHCHLIRLFVLCRFQTKQDKNIADQAREKFPNKSHKSLKDRE